MKIIYCTISSFVFLVSRSLPNNYRDKSSFMKKAINKYVLFSHYRKIATLTYRSGPEWNERFGRKRVDDDNVRLPRIDAPEFKIEDYIRHQVGICFSSKLYINSLQTYASLSLKRLF